MAYVRVKPWERANAVAHPVTEQFITPDPAVLYDEDDPLVKAHPWLFATDVEIADAQAAKRTITEVPIEPAPKSPRKRG
jgi:hypothetical protein